MHMESEFTLRNARGTEAVLSPVGASLTALRLAQENGQFINVALTPKGHDDPSYAGATLAPYAGRLGASRLCIGGQMFDLAANEGPNQLHGGPHNLSRRLWEALEMVQGKDWREIRFTAQLPDGLDGYPGCRRFCTTYRLWDDDRLDIALEARSDHPTVVNLSHHAYWNLSGDFAHAADSQLLRVNADAVYLSGPGHLPQGAVPCGEPPFDLDRLRPLMRPAESSDPQLALANGYNHAFCLRTGNGPAAELMDPASGRRLRLYTDQPCLVVYAGGYLSPARCAVALEPQEHPRLAPDTPGPLLEPGSVYLRHIRYVFDAVPLT